MEDPDKILKSLFDIFKVDKIDKNKLNNIIFNKNLITFLKQLTKNKSLNTKITFISRIGIKINNEEIKDNNLRKGFIDLVKRNYDINVKDNIYNNFIKFIDNLKSIFKDNIFNRLIDIYDEYINNNKIRNELTKELYVSYGIDTANVKNFWQAINKGLKGISKVGQIAIEKNNNEKLLDKFDQIKQTTENDISNIENDIKKIILLKSLLVLDEYKTKGYSKDDFIDHINLMLKLIKDEYNNLAREYNKIAEKAKKPQIEMGIEEAPKDDKKALEFYKEKFEEAIEYLTINRKLEKEDKEIFQKRFNFLFDTKTGLWIKALETIDPNNPEYKKIKDAKEKYDKILLEIAPEKAEITDKYKEIYDFYNEIKILGEKIQKKERIDKISFDKILDFDIIYKKFEKDKRFKDDDEYKEVLGKLRQLKTVLLKDEDIIEIKQNQETNIIDPTKVYFDDYISIFKLSLKILVYLSIVLIFSILLLSIIALFKLIYDIIANIISLFVNGNSSRSSSLDYLSKTITRCTKTNYDDDRFFILTEQKQNLTIFNIGVYMLYLLLLYGFIYLIVFLYAKMMDKTFVGDITAIDKGNLFLTILIVIILYSSIHLMIYKFIFKVYVYNPYKDLITKEKEIDQKITDYVLIFGNSNNKNEILVDEEFFDMLYDASRIDELNDIFMNGIITENKDKCLEQKIMIYNLYNYLREYIVFDLTMKDKFKEYCTTDVDNKPTYTDSNIPMTFVSLMNNDEIKMVRKYNEELPYYNQIPDANIEYFNKLNRNINEKIKQLNLLILTNTNTMIPFFLTILYIIFIVILNIIIFYIIIVMILRSDQGKEEFNEFLFRALYKINEYVYNPIINYFLGNNKGN